VVVVTKFDGSTQEYDRQKVINTCLRMRLSRAAAEEVANNVERKIYDGIRTKQIMRMILKNIERYRPVVKIQNDLRDSISRLRSKPDFEQFVAMLLREMGYTVETNVIVSGRCIEHEIDAVARRGNETLYVEVKHHDQPHTFTGVDVFLIARSVMEDLVEGSKSGKNRYNFTKAFIVCNTKLSFHAERYAVCRNIDHMAWNHPENKSLQLLIEEKKLFPITFLKDVDSKTLEIFGNANIILLKQLANMTLTELQRRTNLSKSKLQDLQNKAKNILSK